MFLHPGHRHISVQTKEFFLHLHRMVLQSVLHLQSLISITASGAGGSSVKMGIKTSPNFSHPIVVGSQYFENCKWGNFHIRHMRCLHWWQIVTVLLFCVHTPFSSSSYQTDRTSAPHISLSLSPWGQLDHPWPLNLQTRLTHLYLHREKPSNKLLWTFHWTCWSDRSQWKHNIPKVRCFLQVPKFHMPHQYWPCYYQIQTKPTLVTEGSSVLTTGACLCLEIWCEHAKKDLSVQYRLHAMSWRCHQGVITLWEWLLSSVWRMLMISISAISLGFASISWLV